jgi:hypothetical protein
MAGADQNIVDHVLKPSQEVRIAFARSTALALTLVLGLANMPLKAQVTADAIPSANSNIPPDWQARAGGKMAFEVASIHLAKPGKFTPPSFALDPGARRSRREGVSSPISRY